MRTGPSLWRQYTQTHGRTQTHARTHKPARARTHTHTHTCIQRYTRTYAHTEMFEEKRKKHVCTCPRAGPPNETFLSLSRKLASFFLAVEEVNDRRSAPQAGAPCTRNNTCIKYPKTTVFIYTYIHEYMHACIHT